MAGKYKQADPAGRTAIREAITATMNQLDVGEQRDRVASMLERLR
jgi:hypothetical protein